MRFPAVNGPRLGRSAVKPRIWMTALIAVGAMLIIVGSVRLASQVAGAEPYPLDKYPGFGRSAAAGLRDDTIAAWESFRRAQAVTACMERAGFAYALDVTYPSGPLATVAKGLGVQATGSVPATSAEQQNAALESSLTPEALERFHRALYGESAADIAAMRETERVPDGRAEDFAHGGCTGEADAAVPSIWTLKRELNGEVEAARRSIAATPEMETTATAFAACAKRVAGMDVQRPADVERLVVSDPALSDSARMVGNDCMPIWDAGRRTAEVAVWRGFEQRNAAHLQGALERYRDIMKTIAADDAFKGYLEAIGSAGNDH